MFERKPFYITVNLFLECIDNFFGQNCKEICNVTCKGCNRTTGICDTGCKPGWRDIYCHKGICLINITV